MRLSNHQDQYATPQWSGKVFVCVLFLFMLQLSTGCDPNNCLTCNDYNDQQHHNKNIHGSGNIVTVERSLAVFHSINHTTVGQVNLTQGEVQRVLVHTDDNIHRYVQTEVINGTLVISIESDSGLTDFDLTFDITIPEVKKLITSSAGNIVGENKIISDRLELILFSAGNIDMDIKADVLSSSLFSAGNLFVKGSATKHVASLYSAGNLSAFALSTDITYIVLYSAGNGYVKVADYLDVTLNSIGSLYYQGNPTIVKRISSIGRVHNAN